MRANVKSPLGQIPIRHHRPQSFRVLLTPLTYIRVGERAPTTVSTRYQVRFW